MQEKDMYLKKEVVINIPPVDTWSLKALKYACKNNRIKGYTKMTKEQLVLAVKEIIKRSDTQCK